MPLCCLALAAASDLRWNFIRLASPAQCTRAIAASISTVPTVATVPTAAVADATALPAAALALVTSALFATFAAAARGAEPVLLPGACQLRRSLSLRRLLPQRPGRVPGMLRLATPATAGATARGPALATSTVTTTLASNATRRPDAAAVAAAAAAAARRAAAAAAAAAVVACRSRAVCAQGRFGSGRARVG